MFVLMAFLFLLNEEHRRKSYISSWKNKEESRNYIRNLFLLNEEHRKKSYISSWKNKEESRSYIRKLFCFYHTSFSISKYL